MDLGLKGKKALVTGASSGLGAAAATALAKEGAEVFICSRTLEKIEAAASRIFNTTGFRPEPVVADVTSDRDIDNLAQKIGKIDILVSNAGGPPPGQLIDHDIQKWKDASELVLFSAVKLTNQFIKPMIQQRWGRLIYITSVGVLQPVDDLILSNTFRAGVTGFCKTISNNYAKYGITANCVCPGYTETERLKELIKSRALQGNISPEEIVEGFNKMIPAQRIGQPHELAALITFLAGEQAGYISGASIPVDGGLNKALI